MAELPDAAMILDLLDEARALDGEDAHVEAAILTVEAGSGACGPCPTPEPTPIGPSSSPGRWVTCGSRAPHSTR